MESSSSHAMEVDGHGLGDQNTTCVCGRDGGEEASGNNVVIQCDICFVWFHVGCVSLRADQVEDIDKYHCPRCETMCGPSTVKLAHQEGASSLGGIRGGGHNVENPQDQGQGHQLAKNESGGGGFVGGKKRKRKKGDREEGDQGEGGQERRRLGSPLSPPGARDSATAATTVARDFDEDDLEREGFSVPVLCASRKGAPPPMFQSEVRSALKDNVMLGSETGGGDDDARRRLLDGQPDLCCSFDSVASGGRSTPPPLPFLVERIGWRKEHNDAFSLFMSAGGYRDFSLGHSGTASYYQHLGGPPCRFFVVRPNMANLLAFQQWKKSPSPSSGTKRSFLLEQNVPAADCSELVVTPGQSLVLPAGWIHAVEAVEDEEGGVALLTGGRFTSPLDVKMQFRLLQLEKGEEDDDNGGACSSSSAAAAEYYLDQYWSRLAPGGLRSQLTGFASRPRTQGRILEGMVELLSNLQIWTFPAPTAVKTDKVIRELARDIKKCEKAVRNFREGGGGRGGDSAAAAVASQQPPPSSLKLTISTSTADLTDRDSVKKLMSHHHPMMTLSTISSPEPPRPPPPQPTKTGRRGGTRGGGGRNKAKKKAPATDLDRELDSAIMGFEEDFGGGGGRGDAGKNEEEDEEENPFRIDESLQRGSKRRKRATLPATVVEEEMSEIYRDDEFVYPTLDHSDEEEEGRNRRKRRRKKKEDSNYSPKKIQVSSREPAPTRENAKKVWTQMAAIQQRRKKEEEEEAKRMATLTKANRSSSSKLKKMKKKKKVVASVPTTTTGFADGFPGGAGSSSYQTQASTSSSSAPKPPKPKKGGQTAKQRLGKILKLKFH